MLEVSIKILMEKMVDYVVPLAVELSVTKASPPLLNNNNSMDKTVNSDGFLHSRHSSVEVIEEDK